MTSLYLKINSSLRFNQKPEDMTAILLPGHSTVESDMFSNVRVEQMLLKMSDYPDERPTIFN